MEQTSEVHVRRGADQGAGHLEARPSEFEIVTNIRRADVTDARGWVILELDGERDEIERGLEWVREQGVRVDPVYEDIVEG